MMSKDKPLTEVNLSAGSNWWLPYACLSLLLHRNLKVEQMSCLQRRVYLL